MSIPTQVQSAHTSPSTYLIPQSYQQYTKVTHTEHTQISKNSGPSQHPIRSSVSSRKKWKSECCGPWNKPGRPTSLWGNKSRSWQTDRRIVCAGQTCTQCKQSTPYGVLLYYVYWYCSEDVTYRYCNEHWICLTVQPRTEEMHRSTAAKPREHKDSWKADPDPKHSRSGVPCPGRGTFSACRGLGDMYALRM